MEKEIMKHPSQLGRERGRVGKSCKRNQKKTNNNNKAKEKKKKSVRKIKFFTTTEDTFPNPKYRSKIFF